MIILSVRDEQGYGEAAREAGTVAYVTKDRVFPDLLGVAGEWRDGKLPKVAKQKEVALGQ